MVRKVYFFNLKKHTIKLFVYVLVLVGYVPENKNLGNVDGDSLTPLHLHIF